MGKSPRVSTDSVKRNNISLESEFERKWGQKLNARKAICLETCRQSRDVPKRLVYPTKTAPYFHHTFISKTRSHSRYYNCSASCLWTRSSVANHRSMKIFSRQEESISFLYLKETSAQYKCLSPIHIAKNGDQTIFVVIDLVETSFSIQE